MAESYAPNKITLDGENLKPDLLWSFCLKHATSPKPNFEIHLSTSAWSKIKKASRFVEDVVKAKEPVYGINTGFGKFAEVSIAQKDLADLQLNLIRSHAAGVGPALSRAITFCMWLLRLNVIARGNSGVRESTVQLAIQSLQKGFLSVIPSQGSVGASGDLAPSAHAVLGLLGEGECTIPDSSAPCGFKQVPALEGLKKLGLKPLVLGPKEGLSLINGTQLTSAYAVQALCEAKNLIATANLALALSVEGMRASHDIYNRKVMESKNQSGVLRIAADLNHWLAGNSAIRESHEDCGRVQDPYSFRCAPQVHGSCLDETSWIEELVSRELNSSTDNPLLFVNEKLSISGGNFHAIYPARCCDTLAASMTVLSNISERRIAHLISPESTKLPAFLINNGGLNSGFMMAQVTAAALVSENKTLCFPASVDSIPTSNDREDHVSMGPIAGSKAIRICQNTRNVLSIEIICALQALDFLKPLKTTPPLEKIRKELRKHIPYLEKDAVLAPMIQTLSQLIAKEGFAT